MMFFKTVTILSGVVAELCVLALPMWALGVPGVENNYAKGWRMGRNKIGGEARLRRQFVSAGTAVVILLAAAARMFQAFPTMRGPT